MNLIKYLFAKKKNYYKFMINFRKIFFVQKVQSNQICMKGRPQKYITMFYFHEIVL